MDIEQLAREAGFPVSDTFGPKVGPTPVGDLLQRFAALVRNEALEEAAVKCEEISMDRWALYKGSKPYTGQEPERASDFTQGQSCGADLCEDAIRSMKEVKQ